MRRLFRFWCAGLQGLKPLTSCMYAYIPKRKMTLTLQNTPIQICIKFHLQKLKIFSDKKNSDSLHISAQNIDCRYSLEPPQWGGSNEYPQSMVLGRNKKNYVYPCKLQFYYIEASFRGSKLYRHVFVMENKRACKSYTDSDHFAIRTG